MPSSKDQHILAIDLGTGGSKVALVGVTGEIAAWELEPIPLILLPNGGAEQKPADWWNAIRKAIERLQSKRLVSAENIIAIGLTTTWSGTVAIDRAGAPLTNAIIWMDTRGAPDARAKSRGALEIEGYALAKLMQWVRLTGGAPAHSGKDSIAHIWWLQRERPEIYRAAHKFLEPLDYLGMRLTGNIAASYASIALHWVTDNRDLARVDYNARLLALAGIPREKLPDLRSVDAVLGTLKPDIARELGVREIPVVMGTPDVLSAAIGSGAVQDYAAHLYIGTSSWIICHVPFKKTDLFHNMASLPSAIPNRYFVANDQETAGACLTFLRDNVLFADDELNTPKPDDTYARFDRLIEQVPAGSGRVLFTPWLYGERTPIEDHTVRGAFMNLSLTTTRAQMIRAVFEGVAFNARWLLGYVEQFCGRKLDPINFIGGGAASNVWAQIHADVFNRTIRQVRDPLLANARGAAFHAAASLGRMTYAEVAARVPIARAYAPNAQNRAVYDELFREFVNVYKQNQKMYARLNSKF